MYYYWLIGRQFVVEISVDSNYWILTGIFYELSVVDAVYVILTGKLLVDVIALPYIYSRFTGKFALASTYVWI